MTWLHDGEHCLHCGPKPIVDVRASRYLANVLVPLDPPTRFDSPTVHDSLRFAADTAGQEWIKESVVAYAASLSILGHLARVSSYCPSVLFCSIRSSFAGAFDICIGTIYERIFAPASIRISVAMLTLQRRVMDSIAYHHIFSDLLLSAIGKRS